MNNWNKELKKAFEAPKPLRKQEFIRRFVSRKVTIPEFLFTQIGYIRIQVWGISIFVMIVAVLGVTFFSKDMLWFICSLTPLLAFTFISENGRSECYKMTELEMATRFSLRSVTLARLAILGLTDLVLLSLLLPLGLCNNEWSLLAVGLYMTTPYLLTTFCCLYIVRKFRGRESLYACVGITACISCVALFSHSTIPYIYQERYLIEWGVGALILCIGIGTQYVKIINQTEELSWNLS